MRKHYGPGPHRLGSSQAVHGRGGESASGVLGGVVDLRKRVWQGRQVGSDSSQTKLSRQSVGAQGEVIAKGVMEKLRGEKFDHLSRIVPNSPIDLIGNKSAVEVKTGSIANAPKHRHWRVTLGEMSPREKYFVKRMSPEQKRTYFKEKMEYVLRRKQDMLSDLSRSLGRDIKPYTMGLIMNRAGHADVYLVPGFHAYMGWARFATDEYYVGTYRPTKVTETTGY